MKFVVPEPSIDLYKDGFEEKDILQRGDTGKRLSSIVDSIEDPLVIALDGDWGSGKSFFLKCWVGAHTLENGGAAKTIYFDAFAHDYLEDPLIALTGVIGERLAADPSASEKWKNAKNAASKLVKPAARIALAAFTAGATEIAGTIVDAGLKAGSEELEKAAEEFWKKEDGKRAAMEQFRDSLRKLTEPDAEGNPQKLVVVIDELDRCRPDFALTLLEIIKHFFSVPHVHFVLGVNLRELQNSVRARYGTNVNAALYLQKFISLSIALPSRTSKFAAGPVQVEYYYNLAEEMGLSTQLVQEVGRYLKRINSIEMLSIRGVQRLLSLMALLPQSPSKFAEYFWGYQIVIAGLLVLKAAFPEMYNKARTMDLQASDLRNTLNLDLVRQNLDDRDSRPLVTAWKTLLLPEQLTDEEKIAGMFGGFGLSEPQRAYRGIVEDMLESVQLLD